MKPFYRILSFSALLAFALCFASCDPLGLIDVLDDDDEETPVTPTNPETPTDKNTVTVTPEGSKVTRGDFSINFPSGTFTKDVQVTVTNVTAGDVGGEHEVSKFYQVTMPATTNKKQTIRIKCEEQDDDIYFVERTQVFARSQHAPTVSIISEKGTYADGEYKLILPPVDNGTGDATVSFAIGLAHVQRWDAEGGTRTRAENGGKVTWHFDINYCPPKDWDIGINTIPVPDLKNFGLFWLTGEKHRKFVEQKTLINGYIREAIDKIHDLGYQIRTDRDIPYIFMASMGEDTDGAFCQSSWSDEKSTIHLNLEKIVNGMDATKLKQTIIHETMHYFQADYDKRPPKEKAGKCYDELLMYESGAVWSEKLMDNNKLQYSDFIAKYIPKTIRGMTDIDGIHGGDAEGADYKAYQNHGYGMPLLLEYMVRKMGLTSTVELYKIWYDTKGPTLANLKAWASKHSYNLFEGSHFDEFVLSLIKGEIDKDVNITQLFEGKIVFENVLGQSGELVKDCFPYGASISRIVLSRFPADSLNNKRLVIRQRSKDVHTYVYLMNNTKNELLSQTATAGDSIVIDGTTIESYRSASSPNSPLYVWLITTNLQNKTSHKSALSARLEYKNSGSGTVTPKELSFPAEGGMQTLKVTATGFTKFGFSISSEYSSWLSGKTVRGGTVEVTAQPNTSNSARTGYVKVYLTNEQNPTEAQKTYIATVKVTQAAKAVSDKIPVKVTFDVSFEKSRWTVYKNNGDTYSTTTHMFWTQYYDQYNFYAFPGSVTTRYEYIDMNTDEHGTHFKCYITYTQGDKTHSTLTFDLDDLDKLADGTAVITNIQSEDEYSVVSNQTYVSKLTTHAQFKMDAPLRKTSGPYDLPGWDGAHWELKGDAVQFDALSQKFYYEGRLERYYSGYISHPDNKISLFLAFLHDATASSAPRRPAPQLGSDHGQAELE